MKARLFGVVTLALCILNVPSVSAAPKKTWVLHMSSNFLGTMKCKINESGVSLNFDKAELEAQACRESNKVLLLNHRDKTYFQETRTAWKGRADHYSKKPLKRGIEGFKVVKCGTEKVGGYKAVHYKMLATVNGKVEPLRGRLEAWIAPDIRPDHPDTQTFMSQVLRVMARVDRLPSEYGAILKVKREHNGKMMLVVDTYKIETKNEKIAFGLPPGKWRKVKDEIALFWGDQEEVGSMEDLLNREK